MCIFWQFMAVHELFFAALGSYFTAIDELPYSCKTLPSTLKGCTAFLQRAATLVWLRKGLWNAANRLHISCTAILKRFCGSAQRCPFRTGYVKKWIEEKWISYYLTFLRAFYRYKPSTEINLTHERCNTSSRQNM